MIDIAISHKIGSVVSTLSVESYQSLLYWLSVMAISYYIGSVVSMIGSVLKRCLKVLSYDRVCSLMGLICDYVTRSLMIGSVVSTLSPFKA